MSENNGELLPRNSEHLPPAIDLDTQATGLKEFTETTLPRIREVLPTGIESSIPLPDDLQLDRLKSFFDVDRLRTMIASGLTDNSPQVLPDGSTMTINRDSETVIINYSNENDPAKRQCLTITYSHKEHGPNAPVARKEDVTVTYHVYTHQSEHGSQEPETITAELGITTNRHSETGQLAEDGYRLSVFHGDEKGNSVYSELTATASNQRDYQVEVGGKVAKQLVIEGQIVPTPPMIISS